MDATETVTDGRIAVTRLYDLAYEADLDRIERDFAASATRLRLTRAKPKAVFYARAPVDISLGRAEITLAARALEVEVRARIYDFGVARLSYEVGTPGMPWTSYVALANELETVFDLADPWSAHLARVRELIDPALRGPSRSGLELDYLFASIEALDPAVKGEELPQRLDLVPLVTGDTQPLSRGARQDVLRHAYTYYENDLVVIGSSRALIVEPGRETDVADILGMAQAQVLEIRHYDERLDGELPRMYDRIEQARRTFGGLGRRRHAAIARSLHTLLAEVTEVSERIDNALVVTEDVYLAKVYAAALDQYRVRSWSTAVDRKLAIIRDTYTALYDEANATRTEYLEIAIVLLIALEIVLAFFV